MAQRGVQFSEARPLQHALAEPEPEPQQFSDETLVQQVARAVRLEETGRLVEALELYEAAYAAYQQACRPRPKLLRRIIEVKRRVAAEDELGMVVQADASSIDPEASERRLRARRVAAREREQLHAVLRLQANFRGYKARRQLAQSRSEAAERFVGGSASSVDATSVVDAFNSAARRGRLRTQEEIKYMERAVSAREQELRAEAARAKRAEAEAQRLRTRLEFFQRAQPQLAAYMEDEASRAELSADLTADLGPLREAAGRVPTEAKAGGGSPKAPWVELCRTAPIQVQFNTLTLELTGHAAATTAVRISLLRESLESAAGQIQGPIAGTEWSRWLDSAGEYFLLQGHHPSEDDTGGGMFTALFDYPQEGEHEATSEDDAEHQPLSMRTNDIVEVVDRSNPDWWFGTVRDAGGDRSAVGYFPAVMVRPYGAQAVAPPDVATALGADVHRTEVHSLIPKIEVVDPAKARDRSPPSRERSASFVERPPALFGAWLHSDHPLMGMIEPGDVLRIEGRYRGGGGRSRSSSVGIRSRSNSTGGRFPGDDSDTEAEDASRLSVELGWEGLVPPFQRVEGTYTDAADEHLTRSTAGQPAFADFELA